MSIITRVKVHDKAYESVIKFVDQEPSNPREILKIVSQRAKERIEGGGSPRDKIRDTYNTKGEETYDTMETYDKESPEYQENNPEFAIFSNPDAFASVEDSLIKPTLHLSDIS